MMLDARSIIIHIKSDDGGAESRILFRLSYEGCSFIRPLCKHAPYNLFKETCFAPDIRRPLIYRGNFWGDDMHEMRRYRRPAGFIAAASRLTKFNGVSVCYIY